MWLYLQVLCTVYAYIGSSVHVTVVCTLLCSVVRGLKSAVDNINIDIDDQRYGMNLMQQLTKLILQCIGKQDISG